MKKHDVVFDSEGKFYKIWNANSESVIVIPIFAKEFDWTISNHAVWYRMRFTKISDNLWFLDKRIQIPG